jgi:ABC-type dipeptide/oligopeptide/nickel transport system ATPase component
MNITNVDYFTFNAHNSLLLVGESGSGKTCLVRKLVEIYMQAQNPNELKFVFFDLKQVEFSDFTEDEEKHPYLLFDVQFGDEKSFDVLDQLADLSMERVKTNTQKPLIFIYIEECDMACRDQKRFDKLVTTISENAKKANMKLVYSTSSPRPDTVSNKLLESFELVLVGNFSYDHWLYEYFGISKESRPTLSDYEFLVVER